jgi:hypothetical protein
MPFQYRPHQNRYVGSITDLMGRGRDAEAQALITAANAQAQAAQASGQAWGGAIQSIGNTIGAIPGQLQAQQDRERALKAEDASLAYTQARTDTLRAEDRRRVEGDARAAEGDIRLKAVLANPEYTSEDIYSAVGFDRGNEIIKGIASLRVDPPEPLSPEERSTHLKNIMQGLDSLSPEMRIDAWPSTRATALANPALGLKPEDIPVEFDQAWFTRMHNYAVEPEVAEPVGQLMTVARGGENVLVQRYSDGTVRDAPQGLRPAIDQPSPGGWATLENPGGEQKFVQRGSPEATELLGQGWRVRETAADRPPSQAQYLAGGYGGRMVQAEEVFARLTDDINEMHPWKFKAEQLVDEPYLQSDLMQSYMQAARNFINAQMRRESGAAIAPHEFENANKQYLPLPGDSEETSRQKAANRQYVTHTMVRSAGPAYEAPGAAGGLTVGADGGQDHWDAETQRMIRIFWHEGVGGEAGAWLDYPSGMPFPQDED